ncbi:hypothetical protein GCM10027051_33490 [Niabella terrae]
MRQDRQVGLFFWLWLGQPYASAIYDASRILSMPEGLKLLTDFNHQDASVSPAGQAHFWGKPIWGYYNSDDQWVLRKQVEMLSIAGIDYIFFDATNAFTYKPVFIKLLAIIDEYRRDGFKPPQIAFYTHSRSIQTTEQLYRELYRPNLFPETWYRVNGKPMIIAYTNPQDDLREAATRGDTSYVPTPLSAEILDFFHFYRPQWPSDPVYPDGFPWIEWIFPQPMHNGVMNVTVASHPNVPMSFSLTRPEQMTNWGRGWNPESRTNITAEIDRGGFFQRQWDHALQADPRMITVGGWNEWIAYKQPYWNEYVLVDAVNKEYSRDIEPMEGGYQDAFYLQLISNVRKYKATESAGAVLPSASIDIKAGLQQWSQLPVAGVNINRNRFNRDAYGASMTVRYQQPAPENLIREIKVAYDDQYIYFLIRGRNSFTSPSGKSNWVNIFIGTGRPSLKGWEGYEYLIGNEFASSSVSIDRLSAGFNRTSNGAASWNLSGNVLQIACPRSSVGLAGDKNFYFKVAADVQDPGAIMSYYTSGSSMPTGRISYMYQIKG